MEQYPKEAKRICFVSNHQSNLDIPVLFGKANLFAGVITKSELKKVPILNWWCAEMHCIYIDRHSPRSSIQAILGGVQQVKSGHPVLIFPEGTRSKDGNVAEFKAGSFHLATKSDAVIVPYAISGTREAFEKRTKWHVTAYLSMCKPVDVSALTDEEKKQVHTVVENEVRQRHDTLVKTNG
jgi:1-acyl-sn-glycerol-3-phosphate acyltransferase